jgi:5-hydroxyisourate hydrolase
MSTLSTHVLDTMHGRPAAGMAVALAGPHGLFAQGVTNADGRVPDLLSGGPADLTPVNLQAGHYRLTFGVAEYFRGAGVALPDPPFLDDVTLDFGVAEAGHYHVPLLVSPFAYSTYRGS